MLKRQTNIQKIQFHLKYRGCANGLICPSMLYCRMRFDNVFVSNVQEPFSEHFFAILQFITSDISMASQA